VVRPQGQGAWGDRGMGNGEGSGRCRTGGKAVIFGQKPRVRRAWFCLTLTCTSIMQAMSKTTQAPVAYSISDLAQEFDLTTRAIRFYEDMGLLQPTRQGSGGRTRVYSPRDRTRLRLILRGKRLGLSLVEAKEIIDLYDSPRDTHVQLERFLEVLGNHRRQLEARMEDLQATLDEVCAQEKEAKSLLRKLPKAKTS